MKANNVVSLLGRVGGDPETKVFDNGNSVANFSLATSEKWTNKQGEKQEKTEWHRITAYGKTGEILAKYLGKGDQVQILGTIRYREWVDKFDQKRKSAEVVVESFSFVGGGESKPGNTALVTNSGHAQQAPQPAAEESEDLPF